MNKLFKHKKLPENVIGDIMNELMTMATPDGTPDKFIEEYWKIIFQYQSLSEEFLSDYVVDDKYRDIVVKYQELGTS